MASRILAGLYDNYEDAQTTAKDLEAASVPYEDISILTNASDGHAGVIDTPPGGEDGAKVGAATGTLVGAGVGLLPASACSPFRRSGRSRSPAGSWRPSPAPASARASAARRAGLVGSLVEAGITKDEAHFYAEAVRRGGTVLLVKADDDRVSIIDAVLRQNSPVERSVREQTYRAGGWTEFDETAPPYVAGEVQHDLEIRNPYRGPQL